jgi:hemolysin activation/secretion protein
MIRLLRFRRGFALFSTSAVASEECAPTGARLCFAGCPADRPRRRLWWPAALPVLVALGALAPDAVIAQSAPTLPPSAQELIGRTGPVERPRLSPAARPAPPEPVRGPGETQTVRVLSVAVSGNVALPNAALLPLVSDLAGQTVTLARIEQARLALLSAYREAGFAFAAVAAGLTPASGGAALGFTVTEGYVAEVRIEGDVGPAATQVLRFLEPLRAYRPLRASDLERALLLVSDIPGMTVRGLLRPIPGEEGALQLVAQVSRSPVSGYVGIDNRAYRLIGPWQAIAVGSINAASELGERTELVLYGAENERQLFGQVSSQFFIGGSGLRFQGFAGVGRAQPGGTLADIGYTGDTRGVGLGLAYPVIRSRSMNLLTGVQFEAFESTVDTGTGNSRARSSRDVVRALRLFADGSMLDDWLGLGLPATNTGFVRFSQGLPGLGASANDATDVGRFGAEFNFSRIQAEIQRTQPLFSLSEDVTLGVQALIAGQWSGNVLPSSEKFYLGGNRLARGFYSGQVTGDSAIAAAFELQLDIRNELPDLAFGAVNVPTQIYAFYDWGQTFENNTDPDRNVASFGGGVRLTLSRSLQLDFEAVRRVTRRVDAGGPTADPLSAMGYYGRLLIRF